MFSITGIPKSGKEFLIKTASAAQPFEFLTVEILPSAERKTATGFWIAFQTDGGMCYSMKMI